MNLRYRIPEVSAMQVLSAIEEKDGQLYLYLDPEDLSQDYLVNQTLQDDCPMFFQAMRVLGENIEPGSFCDALFHAFVYVDFSGIFDRTPTCRTLELQQKAEKLFRRKACGSISARDISSILLLNGLMFTGGRRVEIKEMMDAKHIILIDNPKCIVKDVKTITVKDDGICQQIAANCQH